MVRSMREQLASLSPRPGVYLFRNAKGEALYVGKAKSLRERVRSYFVKSANLEPSKTIMVREVAKVETILTRNEIEALLLEANLIKEHQPPYNISLKDDKSFVYVKISLKDPFPKIETTRKISRDGSRYFGPYTSAGAIYATLKLLKKVFPYRTCENPADKPCFEYELGRCAGHGDKAARQRYRSVIESVIRFLRGDTGGLLQDFKRQMRWSAKRHEFERAAALRDRIAAIEKVITKQTVTSPQRESFDAVGLATDGTSCLAVLIVREGRVIDERNFLLANTAHESREAALGSGLEQYYSRSSDHPRAIFLPFAVGNASAIANLTGASVRLPVRGRKAKLVSLANENARHRLATAKASWERDEVKAKRAISQLQSFLKLSLLPKRIEAFDISNVSGEHAAGSMVVFRDGLPAKKEYRKFRIKTVRGANDPGMMVEILKRRFEHLPTAERRSLTADRWPQPDLIILDGGAGQLGPVRRELESKLPFTVAIAKGGHQKPTEMAERERIFLPDRRVIKLPNPSDALFLLERIRDEAHRFAVGYFRGRHRKATVRSRLDDIPGLGPKRKRELLRRFGSVRGIAQAPLEQLAEVVGNTVAERMKANL